MKYLICYESFDALWSRGAGDCICEIKRLDGETLQKIRDKLSDGGSLKIVFRSITKLQA